MLSALISVFGGAIFAAIGWGFVRAENLQTRVTILETKESTLMSYLKERFDGIEGWLVRIERKQEKV